uniref:Uncharacterized protein n=1 Tax=Caenorhabditis japonica TaxID=281687 RepID=A0A8R1E5D2_CAEJA
MSKTFIGKRAPQFKTQAVVDGDVLQREKLVSLTLVATARPTQRGRGKTCNGTAVLAAKLVCKHRGATLQIARHHQFVLV